MDAILMPYTIPEVIAESCKKHAYLRAIGFVDEEDISYNQLSRLIEETAAFLREREIEFQERVAIIGENSPNWVIAYLAIVSIGAIAVPILPEFSSSEIHHILRHCQARGIFVSERNFHKIEELDFDQFCFVALLDNFSLLEANISKTTLRGLLAEGGRQLKHIKHYIFKKIGLLKNQPTPQDTAAIIYTSGTTGHSKGVMLTHYNITANAAAGGKVYALGPKDRMISILPLAHVYECTLGMILPLRSGASIYYLRKPPTAAVLIPALQKVKPTAMLTVPLIIEKIYKTKVLPALQKNWLLRSLGRVPLIRRKLREAAGRKLLHTFGGELKFFGIGGAGVLPEVEKFMHEANFPYAIGYGLTETSPLIAGCNPDNARLGSTGLAVIGIELRIADPDQQTGIGEIQARGVHIMKGYFRDEQSTRNAFTPDGWFKTGDLGIFDADGYLYIKGRLKNMILGPSGENIYPEAIEAVLNEQPLVLESLVYENQKRIVARVFLDYEKLSEDFQRRQLTESECRKEIATVLERIRHEVNERISSFARIARIIEQREPFEKTPTQKIKRYLYASDNCDE